MVQCNMALVTFKAVIVAFSIGLGSALRLDVSPDAFDTMFTDQLDLASVSNDRLEVKSVLSLEILKKGEDQMIAEISYKGLARGDNWNKNFEVQGNLDKGLNNKFLKLTIKKPGQRETGTYVCKMFYLDHNHAIHEMEVEANVTIANEDITVVAKYLLERIAKLEKNDIEQRDLILTQRASIQELRKSLKELEKNVTDIEWTPIAFSYAYPENNNKLSNGNVIIFRDKIIDVGNAYNPSTGIFTAPRHGLYVFHLVIRSWSPAANINVVLVTKNQELGSLAATSNDHRQQSSISTAVPLEEGETVKAVVDLTNKDVMDYLQYFSYFTGYLVKPF